MDKMDLIKISKPTSIMITLIAVQHIVVWDDRAITMCCMSEDG